MAKAKVTTYELNQQGYENVEPLDEKAVQEKKQEIVEWFENCAATDYAGLLCRELNDYTVFKTNGKWSGTAEEIIDVLQTRGKILDLVYTRDGYSETYQCWVASEVASKEQFEKMGFNVDNIDFTPKVHMYMLFDANDWVIEV